MLRLYARFLSAHDLNQLTDLAKDARASALSRVNSGQSDARQGARNSLPLTLHEIYRSLGRLLHPTQEPFTILDAFCITTGMPVVATLDERPLPRARAAFSFLFTCLPWNSTINRLLNIAPLPLSARPIARAGILGFLQVLSIEISQPTILSNPIALGLRTAYVAGVLHSTSLLTGTLVKRFPIVPDWAWRLAFSYGLEWFVLRLVRCGLYGAVSRTVEDWAGWVWWRNEELPAIPLACPIPVDLECPICKELLKHPMEVLGHHFCEECLDNWLAQGGSAHPLTGEPISREQVSRATLMTLISNRYRDIVVRENGPADDA
jgi:hypothetical protein